MLQGIVKNHADYILFCHGLAFVLLAAACVMRRRDEETGGGPRSWNLLALFAAMHGVGKWMALLLPASTGVWPYSARVAWDALTLSLLTAFAYGAWRELPARRSRQLMLAIATAGVFAIAALSGTSWAASVVRYALGMAAGAWAAAAMLRHTGRGSSTHSNSRAIRVAAIAFGLYALAGGTAVPAARLDEPSGVDRGALFDAAGLLVQSCGALLAVVLSASIWRACGTALTPKLDRAHRPAGGNRLLQWMLLTMVIVAIGGWADTDWEGRKEAARQRHSILLRAVTAAAAIDANQVESLAGTADDAHQPAYLELRQTLREIRRANPDVRFVYLLREIDGRPTFQVDSESENSKDFSPPGSPYDDASDELKSIFRSANPVVEGPLADEYGTWVSGLAGVTPARGAAGQRPVSAVLGMDIDAKLFQHGVAVARLRAIGRTCLLFVLMIALFIFFDYLTRAAEQLRYAALHDPLTGLPNRKLFDELLTQAIAAGRQGGGPRFAVMFVDIDRFKVVNDSLGHHAGDQLLVEVGQRVRMWANDPSVWAGRAERIDVARVCGDEFGIIVHGAGGDADLAAMARQLQQRIAEPISLFGLFVHTSVSIGIVSRQSAESPEDLLRDADTAMYRAKNAGGARSVLFDSNMQSQVVMRLQLEDDLHAALERGEFQVAYQPIIALESGQIDGFEALVRWRHHERGMVPPDHFIPVAEETGLIVPIGTYVLREALRELASLSRQFPDLEGLTMSVNLSKRQLIEENLVQTIDRELRASGIAPHRLKLEVTESVVMEHAEAITPVLVSLTKLGVRLAMDDFGTGHSSLSCLHRFPLHSLKIDRAFIKTMGLNRQYAAIVHAIVTLAHNLGMVVVAEGTESLEQVALLQSLECGYGQGYFFSKPVFSAEIPDLLGRRWFKRCA